MSEEYGSTALPSSAPKRSSGMLIFIILIIIVIAALWYFAPEVLQGIIDFVRSKLP
jgi:hypothetical protein